MSLEGLPAEGITLPDKTARATIKISSIALTLARQAETMSERLKMGWRRPGSESIGVHRGISRTSGLAVTCLSRWNPHEYLAEKGRGMLLPRFPSLPLHGKPQAQSPSPDPTAVVAPLLPTFASSTLNPPIWRICRHRRQVEPSYYDRETRVCEIAFSLAAAATATTTHLSPETRPLDQNEGSYIEPGWTQTFPSHREELLTVPQVRLP